MAKADTRGQKQILEENKQTINFYLAMTGGSTALFLVLNYLIFWESFTMRYQLLELLTLIVYGSSIGCLRYMAKAVYSSTGSLIDGGLDLNMKDGFAEHLKDLIILTVICQSLSLLSNYFWLLWLLAPGRAFYLLWTTIIAPWVFAPAPEVDQEAQDKKNRKLDRRQRRMQ